MQKLKKELQSFLSCEQILTRTSEIYEFLQVLISVNSEWMWNSTYWLHYERAETLIETGACMRFYNEKKPLYPQMAAPGVGLGAGLYS